MVDHLCFLSRFFNDQPRGVVAVPNLSLIIELGVGYGTFVSVVRAPRQFASG